MIVRADVSWDEVNGEIRLLIGYMTFKVQMPPGLVDDALVKMGVRQPAIDGSAVEIHKVPPSGGERKKHGRRGRRGS